MKNHHYQLLSISAIAIMMFAIAGCSTAPESQAGKNNIVTDARQALSKAKSNDRTFDDFLEQAAGYAVFPSVGKGAVGVGGAYGKGVLFVDDEVVGFCDLTQGSIGFQLGGQSYTEILAFKNMQVIEKFKRGNFEFSAQATAVALKSGAGANAKFKEGVAVFTMDEAGLMFEASIGGQKFSYQPVD